MSNVNPPKYRKHKASGRAVVTIEGRDIYLGKWNSAASKEAYQREIAEWLQRGGKPSPRHAATVTELIVAYLGFAQGYYVKNGRPTPEVDKLKTVLRIVRELYGRTLAADFGPLALKTCRDEMIRRDWCRTHINSQTNRVKRVFKWAAENELVPGTVYQTLRCVVGLKRGRTKAREGRKVKPISDADIHATLEHLPAVVSDMVQLQRLTGARPSELCDMRAGDVNRKVDPWEYVVERHKTEHHDKVRVIFIGPKGQAILLPYLLRPADAYCFDASESEGKRRAAQHEARRTPLSCGNRPGTNRKVKPKRTAGEKYTTASYGRAVRRAAQKAGVPTWSPHRLRHSFATEVRKAFGLEATQVALGHSQASVTQLYAERDFTLAARVARQIG